jgi:hypothetical protein
MHTVLERCPGTAMTLKLIGSHSAFFSKMVVVVGTVMLLTM